MQEWNLIYLHSFLGALGSKMSQDLLKLRLGYEQQTDMKAWTMLWNSEQNKTVES